MVAAPGTGTVDIIKSGLKLLNPLQKMEARPLFARADETQEIYGGGLVVGAHALAARTIEAIPAIALTTIANFRKIGQSAGGDQSEARVQIPFDASRLGITDQVGQKFIQDSGSKMLSRFETYESAHPNRTGINIALASLSPVVDALDAFAAGEILTSVAKAGLKATNFAPDLEKAMQQYGIKGLEGDELGAEFVKRFNSKAKKLIIAEDQAGLDELGRATNTILTYMTGKGIPSLNRLGKMVQNVSRIALQDAKYGFTLKNPLFAEIAPDAVPRGLPGYVFDEARPKIGEVELSMGMSTRRVRRVGGAEDQPAGGPYFRSSEGGSKFEAVDEKNVMPAPIKKDLDTFVVKDKDGYAVIEGKTGTQIGDTAETMAAAISSAKQAIQALPEAELTKLIDESPLSPRYTQVDEPLKIEAPKPVEKPRMTPDTPEKAAAEFYDAKIRPEVVRGKAFVIGADDMKDYFGGDYIDKNHPIYSKASFQLYEKALRENPGDTVILTGGGPASGKTENLVRPLTRDFDGIIYDSNLSSYEGALNQIQLAKNAGKKIEIWGVLPNLDSARKFSIFRKNKTGRGISDNTFARGHAGFPNVVKRLLEEGAVKPEQVHLYDVRHFTDPKEGWKKIALGIEEKDPLATLNRLRYTEDEVRDIYGEKNYNQKTGERTQPLRDFRGREETASVDARQRPIRGQTDADRFGIEANLERSARAEKARSKVQKISNPAEAAAPREKRPHLSTSEIDSYEALAYQAKDYDYVVNASAREEERIVDNLTKIFADLKGVDVSDLKTTFTPEDLDMVRMQYEFANDQLIDHPGRALIKFISKKEGQFLDPKNPQYAKTPRERARIEERNAKLMKAAESAFEGTAKYDMFDDPDTIREAIEGYQTLKAQVGEIQENFKSIAKEIRLSKQARKFVESKKSAMARETAKNMKALASIVQAAERGGFRKGLEEGSKKLAAMVKRLQSRRSQIKALQKVYDLTDGQLASIRGTDDPRFMDKEEFDAYFAELEKKAAVEKEKSVERMIIDGMIEEKQLKNPDNLRIALEMPPISKMSLEQLQEFDNILSRYQQYDSFLGPRMIQTVINTDLGPVKTVREIRAALAKDTGAELSELSDVRGSWTDKFTYDSALALKNPLYKYMVHSFSAKMVESDQVLHALETKLNQLAKASRKSRKRTVSDKLVPQDKIIFDYLETPVEEKDLFKRDMRMTGAEIEYAEFVESLYRKWRDILIDKGTLKKWRTNYITHTSRSFFETWKEDGFIRSIGNWWKSFGEQRVDFEAIGPTGEVLGLEKFFKYSLPREGGLVPSKNVAKVVMQYAGSFYKKQALDAVIPKIDAYTFSLQRPQGLGTPRDPTMIGIDGKLRTFVREWLNNKKGRRREFWISQGGQLDATLRAMKLFISLRDLGINIISNTANLTGATMANFYGLSTKAFAKGALRSAKKQGRQMLRKYPGVVGNPPYRQIISAANDIGDTFTAGMFYILQEFSYRSRGQFFLGSLTKDEYLSGVISPKRQAEIKLDMGRFHPMDDMESVVGSTSEGKLAMMYKTWAVPLLFTTVRNASKTLRAFKAAEGFTGKAKVLKEKEAKELLKITVGTAGAYVFWQQVFGDDDETDQSGIARFKRRIQQELASSLSALDPNTWLKFRPYEFAKELAEISKQLVTLEQYEKSGKGYDAGDMKGIEGLQRLLTPAAVRQFMPAEGSGSGGKPIAAPSGSNVSANAALKRLNKLKNPVKSNPALNNLKRLKKQLGN